MKKIESLVGLNVKVYIDGGYELEGLIEHLDDEKIIINNNGYIFMVFKSKIYMVLLNSNEIISNKPEADLKPAYTKEQEDAARKLQEQRALFAENGIAENNQYGSILPITLLQQQPEDPTEMNISEEYSDVDFSISQATLYNEDALLAKADRQRIIDELKKG